MVSATALNAMRNKVVATAKQAVPPVNEELMKAWSLEAAKNYFESGGLFFPSSGWFTPPPASGAAPAPAPAGAPRALSKPDGTPIPFLPAASSGKAIAYRDAAKKVLFLHGLGDNTDLLMLFGLDGLKKCFPPPASMVALEGPYKMTKAQLEEHMIKGQLRDMALAGDIDLFSWCTPGVDRSDGVNYAVALDKVEKEMIQKGGYDVICGFSDGAQVAMQLLERLPQIHKKPAVQAKTRLVMLFGQNDSVFKRPPKVESQALAGVKLFHASGSQDSGYCDICLDEIKGGSYRCTVCFDYDICLKCGEDMKAAVAKQGANKTHTIEHAMRKMTLGEAIINAEQMQAMVEATGLEVVYHAAYDCGHKMPPPEQKVYKWVQQFWAGTL